LVWNNLFFKSKRNCDNKDMITKVDNWQQIVKLYFCKKNWEIKKTLKKNNNNLDVVDKHVKHVTQILDSIVCNDYFIKNFENQIIKKKKQKEPNRLGLNIKKINTSHLPRTAIFSYFLKKQTTYHSLYFSFFLKKKTNDALLYTNSENYLFFFQRFNLFN
jgi:hypothetical protein